MPLSDIPAGTNIHNIELQPNSGGKIVRSADHHFKFLVLTTTIQL